MSEAPMDGWTEDARATFALALEIIVCDLLIGGVVVLMCVAVGLAVRQIEEVAGVLHPTTQPWYHPDTVHWLVMCLLHYFCDFAALVWMIYFFLIHPIRRFRKWMARERRP